MGWSGRCSCPASKRFWQGGAKDKEHAMSQTPNTAIAVIGIDVGKNSFHVVGHDARGAIVLRQKWSPGQVKARLANMPPCLIGMEACIEAHHPKSHRLVTIPDWVTCSRPECFRSAAARSPIAADLLHCQISATLCHDRS
jgi:hypothetical protein